MKSTATKTASAKGRDLSAFRAGFDSDYIVPKKIRDGLAQLGDSWLSEAEFMKLCQLDPTKFARYRDQFAEDFAVEVPGGKRVWAGTKAFAARLREHCR